MKSDPFNHNVGIEDFSMYIPSLYVDVADFTKKRQIDVAKLKNGLGIKAFAVPDSSEDVVTMAAEVICDLVEKNQLLPADIGRIYVGTESMVDGSKPIASYLLGILKQYYAIRNIPADALLNCDVVDMTFACIGAVDAMQNCLDWIRLNPGKKAIVISTDNAKYDLYSPGECTQGAGSIGLLLSQNPKIAEILPVWGVAAQCEHDFFKPLRLQVIEDQSTDLPVHENLKLGREVVTVHKDTPVYDGHYSNECYTSRIREAFDNFLAKKQGINGRFDQWAHLVFHLPYAYHARRVFVDLFVDALRAEGSWDDFVTSKMPDYITGQPMDSRQIYKTVSSSEEYRQFVQDKIERGERASSLVGNMYTGSLFLSLLSILSLHEEKDLSDEIIGCFAYGSGSKSKVFEMKIVPGYQQRMEKINLFGKLGKREPITMDQYEYLHQRKLMNNLDSTGRKVFQVSTGITETNKYAREYVVLR